MATPHPSPVPGLSTTFINPTAIARNYPFLGKHGKKLAAGQTYTQAGDPYRNIRYNGDQDEWGLANALNGGTLAILATPGPVLEDTSTGSPSTIGLTGGSLTVVNPSWGGLTTAIPAILESTPAAGAKGIAAGSTIAVAFGEAVTGTTFAVTQNGSTVSGSAAGSSGNKIWTFTPGSGLTADATVVVTVTAATNGTNTMASSTYTFYVSPIVASIVPANSATGVSAATTVAATFANAVAGVSIMLTQGGPTLAVAGTLTSNAGKTVWTFTPTASINTGKTFTVVVSGATDANGSVMAASTTTFAT